MYVCVYVRVCKREGERDIYIYIFGLTYVLEITSHTERGGFLKKLQETHGQRTRESKAETASHTHGKER